MSQCSFSYSSPDLSDREKLQEFMSYVQGCARLLGVGTQRLVSYQDFLSDEIEGNSRAEDFLSKCQLLVGQFGAIASFLRNEGTSSETGDSAGLYILLNSVLETYRMLHLQQKQHFKLDCPQSVFITGDILQLQTMLSGMIEALKSQDNIMVTAREEHLTETQLGHWGTDCNSGNYICIDIIGSSVQELQHSIEYLSLGDMIASNHPLPLSIPLATLITWLGILWSHDGELLLGNDSNGAIGIRLLLGQTSDGNSSAGTSMPQGNETILLVDDEDMIWDVVLDVLTRLGYTVIVAENGKEAVETYKGNPGGIDLVIMDMVMPGMNGREAFQCLKAMDPKVKVLMSSGYVSEEDAHYVMEAGAVGFLRKPYRLTELAQTVRRLLDKQEER